MFWTIFKKTFGEDSTQIQIFEVIIDGIVFGQAIMWLLAGKICRTRRLVNGSISLVVMLAVGAASVVSSLGFGFSTERVAAIVILAILSLAIVYGQSIAGRMCRRKYSGVKYSLWTALWETVLIAIPLAGIGLFAMIMVAGTNILEAFAVLAAMAMGCVILGALVYGVSLPFLILVQRNHFWRERFQAWSQVAKPVIVNTAEPPENTPAS